MDSGRNLKQRVEVEIHPSSDEIAAVFCAMDEEEQAYFFNELADMLGQLPMQLEAVTQSRHLTESGRYVMRLIGDYSDGVRVSCETEEHF